MSDLASQLSTDLPSLTFKFEHPLAKLTYFKLGGPAEAFIESASLSEIQQLVQYCRQHDLPLTVLGGASNVVVADAGIRGIVLRITHQAVSIEPHQHGARVKCGAGQKTALLVRQTVDAGLTGLEYFLGVPGSVGGAVFNNSHYLQHLLGEYVTRVLVVTPDGTTQWVSQKDTEFGYDTSRFHTSGEIIFEVEFDLPSGDADVSRELIKTATRKRASTQPLGEPSSGCIFQNVPNSPQLQAQFPQFADQPFVPGGFLIDQAGLKGESRGGISVSTVHAAFFVNNGSGTAAQVKELVEHVKQTVKQKFQVELQEEVFYLGSHTS